MKVSLAQKYVNISHVHVNINTRVYTHTHRRERTIYPVAGASGGAILSPWLSIPTKFVNREPAEDKMFRFTSTSTRFSPTLQ